MAEDGRTPFEHSYTIPQGKLLSSTFSKGFKSYYCKPELFNLGKITVKTAFGNEVREQRSQFGKNTITKGKKKSHARRIAEAFINPFTAILIGLALVSAATDMIFYRRKRRR